MSIYKDVYGMFENNIGEVGGLLQDDILSIFIEASASENLSHFAAATQQDRIKCMK